jgi:hypothetical protein
VDIEEPDSSFVTAEENLVILQEWLSAVEQKAPQSNDRWFVTSVLKATERAYGHLRSGRLTDTSYTAWACRNLLELRIIARFGVQSPDNRRKFILSWTIDQTQQFEAMNEIGTAEGRDTQGIAEHLNAIAAVKASLGFADTRYFDVREAAKDVSLDGKYKDAFKVLSKRVHPTPLSVMGEDWESGGLNKDERADFFTSGCIYLSDIVTEISSYAQSNLI